LPWLVPVNALRSLPGKAATVTDRTSSKAVAQDLALHDPEDQTSEMARSLRSECGMARISSQTCYYVAILDRNWVFGRTMPSNRNSTNAVICATGRAQRTQAIGRSDELRGSAANPYRSPIIRASGCRSTRPATRSGSPVFGPIFSPPVALPTRPGPKSPGVSLARLDLSDAARDCPSCGVFLRPFVERWLLAFCERRVGSCLCSLKKRCPYTAVSEGFWCIKGFSSASQPVGAVRRRRAPAGCGR
jgi:hypothetical protein